MQRLLAAEGTQTYYTYELEYIATLDADKS